MSIRAIKTTTAALLCALPMAATSAIADDAEYKSKTTVEQDGDDYKSKTETKRETKIERDGDELKMKSKTQVEGDNGKVKLEEERNVPAPPNTVIIERGISR